MWEKGSTLNAFDGWNITLRWQSISLHKKHAQCDSVINLKVLAGTYSKHHSGKERRRKGQKANANSDSRDPCGAPAEFQVWCLSAVQEIQLRLQSIFSLGSTMLRLTHPSRLLSNTHTHTENAHELRALHVSAIRSGTKRCTVRTERVIQLAYEKLPVLFLFLPYSCQKPQWLQTLHSKLFLFIKTASPFIQL